jgi:hypothetical protein
LGDKQAKAEKIAAIDKFFSKLNKEAIQKKIAELKKDREEFKNNSEFLSQIDDKVVELEEKVTEEKRKKQMPCIKLKNGVKVQIGWDKWNLATLPDLIKSLNSEETQKQFDSFLLSLNSKKPTTISENDSD